MPVTAKFSEEFYDKLGHEVANEIVDWFNRVDLAYRTELKEHNELNFQRFEAVLRAEIAGVEARLDKKIESEIGSLRTGMSELKSELRGEIASLRTDMSAMRADLIKWMFLFWSGTALTVIGVMVALTQ